MQLTFLSKSDQPKSLILQYNMFNRKHEEFQLEHAEQHVC